MIIYVEFFLILMITLTGINISIYSYLFQIKFDSLVFLRTLKFVMNYFFFFTFFWAPPGQRTNHDLVLTISPTLEAIIHVKNMTTLHSRSSTFGQSVIVAVGTREVSSF